MSEANNVRFDKKQFWNRVKLLYAAWKVIYTFFFIIVWQELIVVSSLKINN